MNDDTREPLEVYEGDELILTVRDRRRPKHFVIDNLIMDHWFPLVKETGYAIYSILTRMSNIENESSSVSFSFMCEFLDISRSTLSYYLTLLEMCGLIYRDRPEVILKDAQGNRIKKKFGNKSNTYYILDIEPITHKTLEKLRVGLEQSSSFSDDYRELFAERVKSWMPIQRHWAARRRSRIKTVVGQQALPLNHDGDSQAPDQPGRMTTPDILARINIVDKRVLQELESVQPHEALSLVWFATTEGGLDPERITGYVITNLRKKTVSPAGFTNLAVAWLEMDTIERKELMATAFGQAQIYAEEFIAEDYSFADETIFALFKLGESELEKWIR